MKALVIGSIVALSAIGCTRGDDAADSATAAGDSDPAVRAAHVANAMAANPAGADSILTASGYTRESFDKQLLEIAADSGMSARYAAAKTK